MIFRLFWSTAVAMLASVMVAHAFTPCCAPPPTYPAQYGGNDAAGTGFLVLQQANPPDIPAGARFVPTTGSQFSDVIAYQASTFGWANKATSAWWMLWIPKGDNSTRNPIKLADDQGNGFQGPTGTAFTKYTTPARSDAAILAQQAAQLGDLTAAPPPLLSAQQIANGAGLYFFTATEGRIHGASGQCNADPASTVAAPSGACFGGSGNTCTDCFIEPGPLSLWATMPYASTADYEASDGRATSELIAFSTAWCARAHAHGVKCYMYTNPPWATQAGTYTANEGFTPGALPPAVAQAWDFIGWSVATTNVGTADLPTQFRGSLDYIRASGMKPSQFIAVVDMQDPEGSFCYWNKAAPAAGIAGFAIFSDNLGNTPPGTQGYNNRIAELLGGYNAGGC